MEIGMKARANVDLDPGDMAMLSGGPLYIYGPVESSPEEQVAALEWGERMGRVFFRGKLGSWPRFIMGDSREALELVAMPMAKGLA
jgi:hypothetical protein